MHARPQRLAVMLSGAGRTLANLLEQSRTGRLPAQIALVIASRECPGTGIARAAGVEALVMPGVIPGAEFGRVLHERRIDLVALAGYLKLIQIPPEYRGRIVNIHPALLPDFGGPGMYGRRVHEAVLASARCESGCTVHLCDEHFDRGEIILQRRCPVLPGDTPETLADRVFELEKEAYPEALRRLLASAAPSPAVPGDHPRP
jgi:phosphoribosylglycinamide formyltransferase 1